MKTGQLGRYEIVRHLANGGMAQVLLARATGIEGFSRHVVVKRIHQTRTGDPAFVKMFLDEARLAARLHHHNIVQVHDIGQEGGEYFFTMEYIHGEDLRSLLMEVSRRGAHVPLEHIVNIVMATASALHYAHELRGPDRKPLGLVHRDVSPANIIVGFDGNVKVVDFGIAKAAALRDTNTGGGLLKGKVAYMAPEQCAGEPVDRRSDVYALGVVLFELVTVRRLFKSNNDYLTMSAIVAGAVPFPSKYRPDVPPALEDIIFKALSVAPDRRYASADELRRALDQFASQHGLRTSATGLGDYMKSLFGERPEPWLTDDHATPLELSIDFDGSASGVGITPPDAPSPTSRAPTEPAPPSPLPTAASPASASPAPHASDNARVAIPPKRGAGIPNATPPSGVAPVPGRPAVARTASVTASTVGSGRSPSPRITLASGVVTIPERSKSPTGASSAPRTVATSDARSRPQSAAAFASKPTTEMDPLRVSSDELRRLGVGRAGDATSPSSSHGPAPRPTPPPVPTQARPSTPAPQALRSSLQDAPATDTDATNAQPGASAAAPLHPSLPSSSPSQPSTPNKWPKGTDASVTATNTSSPARGDVVGSASTRPAEAMEGSAAHEAAQSSSDIAASSPSADASEQAHVAAEPASGAPSTSPRRRRVPLIMGGLVAALAAVWVMTTLGGSDSRNATTPKKIEHANPVPSGSAGPARQETTHSAGSQTGSAAPANNEANNEPPATPSRDASNNALPPITGSAATTDASLDASPRPNDAAKPNSTHKSNGSRHSTRPKAGTPGTTKTAPKGSWNPDELFPD